MEQRLSIYKAVNLLCLGAAVSLGASSVALADPEAGPPAPGAAVVVDRDASGGIPGAVAADFGPVDTPLLSLANVAPGVYSWFNDGLVFGLPGTRTGGIAERTHLTNDWGGLRTKWAQNGVFLNLYNTTAYQQVWDGLNPGGAVLTNTQLSLDLDTGRLGWWDGGLLHAAIEARHGSENADVFGAGTLVPTYYGAVLPQPGLDDDVVFTNLFLEQSFGKFGLIAGVIPGLYVPDRTLFGDDWKQFFGNYSFNENPIFTQFYNPQTTTITGSWSPNEKLAFSLGVYDAKTDTTDIGKDFFSEINIYGQATYSYEAFGVPGQVLVGGLWSNQDKLNLRDPLNVSHVAADVGLDGVAATQVTPNIENSSWFTIANFSQYLYVKTEPEKRKDIMARGEPLRGIGTFGRLGYSPAETTAITQHFSLAVFAHGLFDRRPDDTFGFGGHYNKLSGGLKDGLGLISGGDISINDESGIEVFYDFAITPAVSLNLSYQHVWNPFKAALVVGKDSADILMVRVNSTW